MRLKKNPRAADLYAILLLSLLPFVFFWQVALGHQVFNGDDISSLFYPLGVELARALQAGQFPLWSVNLLAGYPIFAEGHIAALDPFNLVLYRLLPSQFALSYLVLLRLALSALGMYLFGRSSGLQISAAFLAGIVFSFSGFAFAHLQHLTLEAVAAWLPWLLFFQNQMQRVWRAGKPSWAIWFFLATICIALEFLSGFPQIAIINLIPYFLIAFFGIAFWNRAESTRSSTVARSIFISIALAILSIGLGIGIAAIQLLPAAELLNLSVRAQEASAEFFSSYSLAPEYLTQFIAPFLQLGLPAVPNLEYWGYIGIVPLLLALTALLRRDARIWFFFLLALFSLILALGEFTPLYQLLYFVPIFNRFRVPARFLFPFIFSMTFLAAICFDKLINHLRDSTTSSRAAEFIAGIFAILFVVMIGFAPLNVGMWIQVWQILPALFAFLGIIAMILALKRVVRRREFATVIIGLSLLDLTAFAFPFLTTVDTLISPSEFIQAPLSISAMDSTTFLYRMYTNVYNTSLRPNHQLIFDKQSAQAYTPLPLQRNDNYLFRLSPQMLNLLNVRYYLLPNGEVPPEFSEPTASVLLDPLRAEIEIRSTPTARVEIISYSDNTENLADGFLAGELEMKTANESVITFPIRLGIETADWAYASKAEIKHRKLQNVLSFPAFLISINRSFDGFKYVAQYTLPTQTNIISIHARTFLPAGKLIIENISLIDQEDKRSSLAALAHRNDLALVFKSHAVAVMENRDVLPRALVVHSAQVVSDDHALENMRSADFDPRQTVLLAQESALASTNTTPSDLTDKIEIVKYESETVAINVTADRAGYLILADTFYPGWEAYVDGQRTPIYRADYIFRAVPIRTGSHTIIFEFHPASFVIGAWISAISLILSGVLARIGLKKSWFTVPNAKENS